MKLRIRLLLLFAFLASGAWAGDISVRLILEQNQVNLEDELELRVEVSGTRQASPPRVAGLEAFEIGSTGTSSQVQIVNTTMEVKAVTQYTLYPKSPGNYVLGPAVVEIGGQKYTSNTAKVTVVKSGAQGAAENRALYIKQSVSNAAPYVNEQVIYTFRLYSRVPITNAKLSSPDFKGFWKESLGEQREFTELVDGVQWSVTEIRTALFPLAGGKITIPESSLVADVVMRGGRGHGTPDSMLEEFFGGGFQRTKRLRVVSEPVEVSVRDLPPGAPANYSGLVGKFEARSQLSRREAAAGESVSLTLTVEGSGNIRDLEIPFQPPADLKVYPDQPKTEVLTQDSHILGRKVFTWALIPLKEGEFEIPLQTIAYFDPKSGSYQSMNLGLPPLKVTPGEKQNPALVSSSPDAAKKRVEVRGEDLMPLKRGVELHSDVPTSAEGLGALVLFAGFPIGFAVLFGIRRRRVRYLGDRGLQRRSRAMRQFRSGLKALEGENGKATNEASRLLREYLGNKGNFDGGALTSAEAAERLKTLNLSAASIDAVRAFLSRCESAQWGGGSAKPASELRGELETLVKQIEKEAP